MADIINELLGASQSFDFDTDHRKFREQIYLDFYRHLEILFINNYRFDGDPKFTRAKQRIFLKMLFNYGHAAVVNTLKVTRNVLDAAFYESGTPDTVLNNVAPLVEKEIGNYLPMYASPLYYDASERIASATVNSAPRNNVNRQTLTLSRDVAAFASFDLNSYSGRSLALTLAYKYALIQTVIKKRISVSAPILVSNNGNNAASSRIVNDIYSINKSEIALHASSQGDGTYEVDVTKYLSSKLLKLDMTSNETLQSLYDAAMSLLNDGYAMIGVRVNTSAKREKNISAEFMSDNIKYELLNNEIITNLEMFAEDYAEVFGKNITVINIAKELADAEMEKAEKLANGGNEQEKNKGKGGKDGK